MPDYMYRCKFTPCECPTKRAQVVPTEDTFSCGHCLMIVYRRPHDVVEHVFTCEGGVCTWYSRELDKVVHKCPGVDLTGVILAQDAKAESKARRNPFVRR